jgi:hypothetical protein
MCVFLPRGTQVKFKTELARDLGEAMGVPSRRFSVEAVNGAGVAVPLGLCFVAPTLLVLVCFAETYSVVAFSH